MNYFKIGILCIIALLSVQDKQFVDFKADEVKVSTHDKHLTVTLPFEILKNYHIQSEKIEDNNFIPTEIHFDDPIGYEILGYEFSKVKRETITLDQLKCEVLSDDLEITLRLEKLRGTNKQLKLKGHLYYQACDDMRCFYPRNLPFNVNWPY